MPDACAAKTRQDTVPFPMQDHNGDRETEGNALDRKKDERRLRCPSQAINLSDRQSEHPLREDQW